MRSLVSLPYDCLRMIYQLCIDRDLLLLHRTCTELLIVANHKAAYRQTKLPFAETFDIISYRTWHRTRAPLQLVWFDLLSASASRILLRSTRDIQLFIPCYCKCTGETRPVMNPRWPIEEFSTAARKFHNLHAVSLVMLSPAMRMDGSICQCDRYALAHSDITVLTAILSCWSSQLISFSLDPGLTTNGVDMSLLQHMPLLMSAIEDAPKLQHLFIHIDSSTDFIPFLLQYNFHEGIDGIVDIQSGCRLSPRFLDSMKEITNPAKHLLLIDEYFAIPRNFISPGPILDSVIRSCRLRFVHRVDTPMIETPVARLNDRIAELCHPHNTLQSLSLNTYAPFSQLMLDDYTTKLNLEPIRGQCSSLRIFQYESLCERSEIHNNRIEDWTFLKQIIGPREEENIIYPHIVQLDLLLHSERLSYYHSKDCSMITKEFSELLMKKLPALHTLRIEGVNILHTREEKLSGIFLQIQHLTILVVCGKASISMKLPPPPTENEISSVFRTINFGRLAVELPALRTLGIIFRNIFVNGGEIWVSRTMMELLPFLRTTSQFVRLTLYAPSLHFTHTSMIQEKWLMTYIHMHVLWKMLQPSHSIPQPTLDVPTVAALKRPFLSHDIAFDYLYCRSELVRVSNQQKKNGGFLKRLLSPIIEAVSNSPESQLASAKQKLSVLCEKEYRAMTKIVEDMFHPFTISAYVEPRVFSIQLLPEHTFAQH